MLTVADELAFDAFDEETRKVCEKIIDARTEEEAEARVKSACNVLKEAMDEELDIVKEDRADAWKVVKALEAQLEHFGVKPNRLFDQPAEKPKRTVEASQFEARPKKKKDGDDFPRPMGATPRD
jgi:hypothetical protein